MAKNKTAPKVTSSKSTKPARTTTTLKAAPQARAKKTASAQAPEASKAKKEAVRATMKRAAQPGGKKKYTIGVDLGGTKVLAALVDEKGNVVRSARRPTVPPWMSEQDPRKGSHILSTADVKKHIAYTIKAMTEAVEECLGVDIDDLAGIGLASAGPMNIIKGTLEYPSNFKGWKIVPLVKLLEDSLKARGVDFPIAFQNDAMAASLAEGWVGRARGCNTFAVITVGTGIGTGVIFNGKPAQSAGMGSEWGHILVNSHGIGADVDRFYERSVEGLASGTSLIRRANARGFVGGSSSDLARAADKGDLLAIELFRDCSEALACLFYSLSLGFHPEKFVVSGGLLAIRKHFLPRAIKIYRELITRKNPKFKADIEIAELGTMAGVIGAAYLPHIAE